MYTTAISLINKIEDSGFKAYIVGGFPRDLYLNRKTVDIDICTSATPMDLEVIFEGSILPKVQYGSVTVVYKNIHFEITTFRKDIKYENNRLPIEIKYIDKLEDDLVRRDFTINTVCIDKDGNMIDLMNGIDDMNKKIIKTVGDPYLKIEEDSLRILRAIRFATILDFSLDNDLKESIKKYSYLLKKLSYYRKKDELDKIFASPNSRRGIELICELGIEKDLELNKLCNVKVTSSVIGIWAQLDVMALYDFTSNEKDLIIEINELLDKDLFDNAILYKHGLYVASVVGEIRNIDKKRITRKYISLPIKNRKEINIVTNEILEILNKKPGSFLKDIYIDLEEKILYNELINENSKIKEYIIKKYKDI